MFFFAHWSNTESEWRLMESIEMQCLQCDMIGRHSFKLYKAKTKHYSVVSFGANYSVTITCHNCLVEQRLEKLDESKRISGYRALLFAAEAQECLENDDIKKANKLFKKSFQEHGDPHIMLEIAKTYAMLGDDKNALAYMERAKSAVPADDKCLAWLKTRFSSKGST